MSTHRFRAPNILVFALIFSPAFVLLHACMDKRDASNRETATPPALSKSEDQAAAAGADAATATPDLQSALDSLTTANVLEVRDRLRRDPQEWSNRLTHFYRAWGRLDPGAALNTASSEGPLALSATLGVIEGWTFTAPDQARDWVGLQASDSLRSRYATPLLRSWPADDLESLAIWSQNHPALLPQVALKWAATSPPQAARWLGSLPTSPEHRRATESLFRQWAKADPGAAGDHLIAFPAFPGRDAALAAYASTVVADDPGAAEQWAHQISDPALRQQVLAALPSARPLPDSVPASLSRTP